MSEPAITPLAQRLAEENNVDWRALQGSGDSGRIVERDVLEYLARVMAGEEAVNPTAEPLPEGLEAWPDADGLAADRLQPLGSNDWSSSDEDDDDSLAWPSGEDAQDLGTPVAFDAEEAELRATGEYMLSGTESQEDDGFGSEFILDDEDDDDDSFDLSEDIFLFGDDDDEPVAEAEAAQPDGLPASHDGDHLAAVDGLEVEPEEGLLGRADDLLDDSEFEDADLTDLAELDGELDTPELAEESLRPFESGFDRDSLEQKSSGWGDYATDQDGGAEAEPEAVEGDSFEIDFSDLDDEPEPADFAGEAEDHEEPLFSGGEQDGWQDGAELAAELQDSQSGDEAEALARRIEAAFDSVADSRPEFENFDLEDGDGDLQDDLDALLADEEATDADELPWAAGSRDDSGGDATEPEALIPDRPADEPQFVESIPVPATAGAPAPSDAGLPLADFGNLLRRRLDVGPLSQAQSLVGTEISGGDSVSAVAFLLRAARRAAAETELFPGSDLHVAAAVIVDNSIELVEDNRTGFRALAQELQQVANGRLQGTAERGSIQLAVADMSGFEVDEAILDLGVPMLSLGRSLLDEGTGDFRSTITLSGHFDLQQGARFLQVASELLANPLRLLL